MHKQILRVLALSVLHTTTSIGGSLVQAQSATPMPDLTSQTLLEHHFAAGELAVTDEDFFIWARYSLAPETALKYPKACGAPKIALAYVESGTYAIRAEGPLEVTRVGATESIPAGDEVLLNAGDSFLYLNETGDQFTGFRNPGPGPLVVTEAIWRLTECIEGPPYFMQVIWDAYGYEPAMDAGRPVTISMRRITAPPGVRFPAEGPSGVGWLSSDARVLERVYVETGNLEIIKYVPNDSGTPSTPQGYEYPEGRTGIGGTVTLDLDLDPAGTTFRLGNRGGIPLVVTVFTVAYEDTE